MTSRPYNRIADPRRTERGASLVEILVVMVVLVIGIFTIIRIFPKGFEVLQGSANVTVAHRMADAEVEFWNKNAANLPEGIVAVTPGPPGYSGFDPTARPGDCTTGTNAYGDDDPQFRQNVQNKLGNNATEDEIDRWVGQNRQRRILGEVTRIPAPAPVVLNGEQYASVYPLAYAPIDWPAVDPLVNADSKRIYQVVQNLLTNAVKYSPDGGCISLTAHCEPRCLVVSVSDEGLGMPTTELDRIFDRFHRVHGEMSRVIGGTGLGLAICKGLVEAHGGRIWAESEGQGHGSTFRFTLPLLPEAADVAVTATPSRSKGAHDHQKTNRSRR